MHFAEGSQVLFVGEGDFSFITSLTREDRCVGVHLTATALQEELSERARANVEVLRERGIKVALGVDATCLHLHPLIQHHKYTYIVFNFPHVGGKMRIERNRKLLRDFFRSAAQVLEIGGWVVVTLCGGQGGVTLDPVARRYDDSWKVILMASHANLVLRSIHKFATESYPGYSATGYRSMEKGFCQDAALTFMFQVSVLPPEPADAQLTQDVWMCDGSSLQLPSFLHTQIQKDIVADSSSLVGHFYSLLLGVLRGNPSVHCCEKLVFRKEGQEVSLRNYSEKLVIRKEAQEESLRKCEAVSKCASLLRAQPTVFCHSSYRISTEGSLRLEPLIALLCLGNTEIIENALSQIQNMKIRNISKSFTPEVKTFTFGDFVEDKMCFRETTDLHNTAICYLISVTSLARQCGGVDENEVWGSSQLVSMCDDVLTYSPFSLFPGEYTYDLSFWETKLSSGESGAVVSNSPKDGRSVSGTLTRSESEVMVSDTKCENSVDSILPNCESGVIVSKAPEDGSSVDGILPKSESETMVSNPTKHKSSVDSPSTRYEDEVTVSSIDKSSVDSMLRGCNSEVTISFNNIRSADSPLRRFRNEVKVSPNGKSSNGSMVTRDRSELTVSPNDKSSLDTPSVMHGSKVKVPPLDKSLTDSMATGERNDLIASSNNTSSIDTPLRKHVGELTIFPQFKSSIDTIITNMGREALKSYKLLSVYNHPKLGRRSYTYRLVYRSWRGALSDQAAKQIHSQIGRQLEKCLGVEVRW